MMNRRRFVGTTAAIGLLTLAGCADEGPEEPTPDDEPPEEPAEPEEPEEEPEEEPDEEPEEEPDEEPEEEPEGLSLTVTVGDAEGNPIEGATVTVSGGDLDEETAETDSDGDATFDDLEADEYTVVVEAEGYEPVEEEDVPVDDEQYADMRITITLYEEGEAPEDEE